MWPTYWQGNVISPSLWHQIQWMRNSYIEFNGNKEHPNICIVADGRIRFMSPSCVNTSYLGEVERYKNDILYSRQVQW